MQQVSLKFLCLLFGGLLPAQAANADQSRDGTAAAEPNPVMLALARPFRALGQSLDRQDASGAAIQADQVVEASKGLGGLAPQRNAELVDVFAETAKAIGTLASTVATRARAGDLPGAVQAFADLRADCVACHARFRDGNRERGLFPAWQNTIIGEVSVQGLDGKRREDQANVLVFLETTKAQPDAGPPRRHQITQKDTRFLPRVLPVLKGARVEFPNEDLIYHNVFSLSQTQPFDLGAYGPGESKAVAFPRTGLARVYCNMHPQMVSTIVVLDNPWFALTDRKGMFVITGVPAGTHVLRTWHEFGGEHKENIALDGATVANVAFTIQEDKTVVEHKNKFGKPYRDGYR